MQIHELNNFSGTLGSGAYLAIDDGNDTGKISSQGLLAATEARIDNIIAGPAPSAEEIVDARLGDDGVTYPSLGDAIRDQFSDVKSALGYISINPIWNSNTYINESDGTRKSASTCDSTDYIQVVPNAIIDIYALMRSEVGYAFYDETLTYVSGGTGPNPSATTPALNKITVPSTAKYLRFSNLKSFFSTDNVYIRMYLPNNILHNIQSVDGYYLDSLSGYSDLLASDLYSGVELTSTANRYIASNGVQGSLTGNTLYQFDSEEGEIYHILTYRGYDVSAPLVYANGSPYPSASNKPSGLTTIVGDGNTVYVNYRISADYPIPVVYKAPKDMSALSSEVSLLSKVGEQEHSIFVTTEDTENRYITTWGAQGNFNGYTLKVFTTLPNAVYLIYSEVNQNQAESIPIAYIDGTAYTNNTGKGWVVVVGNGEQLFVNSLTASSSIIKQYVFSARKDRLPNVFRMFDSVVCCGDSLTYSLVYTSSVTSRQALVPYPKAVEKITGTPTDILATAGYTSQQWWEQYNSQITGGNKLYLIYLGTNDSASSLTDTADTDCAGDDLTIYATTATGYYGRIIRKILDTGSKCVLIKIGLGNTGYSRNVAIQGLADRFNVPVVTNPQYALSDMYYHYGDTTNYANTVHLNDIGYEMFAELIVDRINDLSLAEKYNLMPRTV